ncbi:hypothetical protein [Oxalicibacterium solurbis]|uniref:hypothetical protein n=1 Tax=Oxalicibacterium solurbis TaxID=69280 RepID=UPI003FCCA6DB
MKLQKLKGRDHVTPFLHSAGLITVGGILHFFTAPFHILAETMNGVAGSERKTHCKNAHEGNDFFHDDFPFKLNEVCGGLSLIPTGSVLPFGLESGNSIPLGHFLA